MLKYGCLVAVCAASIACDVNSAQADVIWTAAGGHAAITLDRDQLDSLGLVIRSEADDAANGSPAALVLSVDDRSDLTLLTSANQLLEVSRGGVRFPESASLEFNGKQTKLKGLILQVEPGSNGGHFKAVLTSADSPSILFELSDAKSMFANNATGLYLDIRRADVRVAPALASLLNGESLAGKQIGTMDLRLYVDFAGGDDVSEAEPMFADDGGAPRAPNGPDVIVGGVGVSGVGPNDVVNFGPSGDTKAFSVATTSCNIGNQTLWWYDCGDINNPICARHPVISQNIFRLKGGRFEQLGQSWLKHGFCALSQNLCQLGCSATDCDTLGIGCSDPYTASRNSSGLGPKSEVNAFTGVFPYPFGFNPTGPSQIAGRTQAKTNDINPTLNAGALYFVETAYITQDDAAAGNADNNCSYRPISFDAGMNMVFNGSTVQQIQAIRAWKANDPSVVETDIRVPNEGLMILAAKASDNGNGTWHYEYALFNQNSDRSARSFSVPVGGAEITNIGFRDVDYHSGEPYSLTDWTASTTDGVLTWSTQTFAQNVNANALRWGTMYNFRFDANVAPSEEHDLITIGLFKPGTPASVTALTVVPTPSPLFINLAGPAPIDVMPACRSVSFDVSIEPGSQNLLAGSPTLHYRYDDGPFQTEPLVALGGNLHRATLPPCDCGAEAEYYVSAEGHLGGIVYLPDTAPAVAFTPQVGKAVTVNIIDENFNAGLPVGWSATGLWNVTSSCPVAPANCSSGQWAYFGQTSTCNYETGAVANGNLSVDVAIPDTLTAELRYCSNFEREAFALSDWPSVRINGVTVDQPAFGGLGSSQWVERVVNLTPYAGQNVTLTFNFNTNDAFVNNFRGWQIDNVRLSVIDVQCNAVAPVVAGDLTGDGLVDGRDVVEFTAAALQSSVDPEHLCPGDFNGDGVVNDLDVTGMVDALMNQ